MYRVWRDAEVPVQYEGPPLKLENIGKVGFFGHLLTKISPIIIVVFAIVCVKLSYYAAPKSIIMKEQPVVYQPKYFLAVGHTQNEGAGLKMGSFLFPQIPLFQKRSAYPMYMGGSISAAVTSSKMLDMRITLPYEFAEGEEMKHLLLLVPLTLQFPNIEKKNSHTLLRFEAFSRSHFNTVEYTGRLLINQKHKITEDEKFSNITMEQILENEIVINEMQGFTIDSFTKIFEDGAFSADLYKTTETISAQNDNMITIHMRLRIPEIFAEVDAPFWNMFKTTYVQLFYWFWLIYFLWNKFLRTAFQYGIIPAAIKYPLKDSKEHAD